MIRCVAEEEHANDGAGKRDTGDICLRRRVLIRVWVDGLEHRVDGADDLETRQ